MSIRKSIQKSILFGVVALLLFSPLIIAADSAAASSDSEKVLIDMGNGDTYWSNVSSMGTFDDIFRAAASSDGLDYSSSSNMIIVNGVVPITIGAASNGGSFIKSGTTGVKSTAEWVPFEWDSNSKEWVKITDISSQYTGGSLALGFYADGQVPSETPDNPSSWTMIRGDAQQNGAQDTTISNQSAVTKWSDQKQATDTMSAGVDAGVLSAQGYVFVKFNSSSSTTDTTFACYTMDGNMVWSFSYPSIVNFDLSTPAIIGDYIYIPASYGYIFKIPMIAGPGDNNQNVTTIGNIPVNSLNLHNTGAIPVDTPQTLIGANFGGGPGSLAYDSGVIYCSATNGMLYCFDLNLNLIWSYQMEGSGYFFSPTVYDDYLFSGALNGTLYALHKTDGTLIDQASVYTNTVSGHVYGSVQQVSVFGENGDYTLMFEVSDGRGMSSKSGGVGIYGFDGSKLSKKSLIMDAFGLVANYVLPVNTSDFQGVYLSSFKGIYRVSLDGTTETVNDSLLAIKAPMVLVNGNSIYIQGYAKNEPVYIMSLDGTVTNTYVPDSGVANYSMAAPLVIDGWVYSGNDSGINAIYGVFPAYGGTGSAEKPLIYSVAIIIAVILVILVVIYALIRFVKGEDKPFNYISRSVKHYLGGEDLKHNKRSKHRLLVVLAIGITCSIVVFIASLCIGYNAVLSPHEMFTALFAAIAHGGADPSNINQIRVFESRLPRTIAALAVGIGLSVAGSMYQAIIRNPLVDPYIMGVSAGAGTAAVAVIAFNFTFFGLFASHSIYATAFTAMIGGLIAFAVTMFIAERAGGSSINYVLAGVVVGLAFSSVQTLMLSMAGHSVSNALSWLFGSFANVSWNQVWLILIPGIAMSLVPLIWAKEFNLVLLGEDQAQQMGLNVRRFNRLMLVLASILTSLCVAFVGIIGFVGLVIPHLCRMMLGGDHRLVLPASIAFGAALMMFADLAARTLYLGLELPVGAITTIIGVPVFAYLLIRRGKMYEG